MHSAAQPQRRPVLWPCALRALRLRALPLCTGRHCCHGTERSCHVSFPPPPSVPGPACRLHSIPTPLQPNPSWHQPYGLHPPPEQPASPCHASGPSGAAAAARVQPTLACSYAPKNIRVNCVAPGLTRTPMTAKITGDLGGLCTAGRWARKSTSQKGSGLSEKQAARGRTGQQGRGERARKKAACAGATRQCGPGLARRALTARTLAGRPPFGRQRGGAQGLHCHARAEAYWRARGGGGGNRFSAGPSEQLHHRAGG